MLVGIRLQNISPRVGFDVGFDVDYFNNTAEPPYKESLKSNKPLYKGLQKAIWLSITTIIYGVKMITTTEINL